jgi:hypothetical protein
VTGSSFASAKDLDALASPGKSASFFQKNTLKYAT